MRNIFLITLLFPLSLWGFFEVEGNNPNGDVQTWFTQTYTAQCNPKSSIVFLAQERFADGSSKMNIVFVQAMFAYEWRSWVTLAGGYRSQWILTNDATMIPAYVPMADVVLHGMWKGWQFADRNRLQLFTFSTMKSIWFYRNRPILISPWKIGAMGFRPYIADEMFFVEGQGFNENRLEIGGLIEWNRHATSGLYYLYRDLFIDPNWRVNQAIGVECRFHF